MLPSIGIMVGFYIMTRCLSFLHNRHRQEPIIVKIMAGITFIITTLLTLILVVQAFLPGSLPRTP